MKNVKAYRTIGEISELFKIQPHILRFWEKSFNQIKPIKRKGGRRLYSEEDIKIIRTIKKLINEEGYTVKGVKKYLSKNKLDKIKNDGVIKISQDLDIKLNQINKYLTKARNILK